MLQRVDLQHHIEAVVAEHRQAVLEIELQHVDTAAHAGQHVGVIELHAVAAAAALLLQIRQQAAIAAAQVQHARALGHEAGNRFHGGFFGHAISLAMLSK
ncbi:hypothetical protein D3C71_1859490 [compost metagenome]